jgi:hypothetical protein
MIVHFPDGKNVSVHGHSDKVWLTCYSGVGTVIPLTAEQAQEIGLALYRMGRKLKRG